MPNPSQPTVQVSQPSKPSAAVSEPAKKHRGRAPGSVLVKRPADEIYADKMDNAFRSAELLVRRLKSLSRDKLVNSSPIAKEKYERFLATLIEKAKACAPSGEAEEETLADWTG